MLRVIAAAVRQPPRTMRSQPCQRHDGAERKRQRSTPPRRDAAADATPRRDFHAPPDIYAMFYRASSRAS